VYQLHWNIKGAHRGTTRKWREKPSSRNQNLIRITPKRTGNTKIRPIKI